MPYGELSGPSSPSHTVQFDIGTSNGNSVFFTVTAQGQDADPADLDTVVQTFVDLVAANTKGFIFRQASKSGLYQQAITPTV